MICPRCKKEMKEDAQYCPHCGLKLEKCPTCQQPVIPGSKFCSYCGAGLVKPEQQSQLNGYYKPLGQLGAEYDEGNDSQLQQESFNTEEKTSFKDVKVSHKVDKKVILIAVMTLALLTTAGYVYIKNSQDIEFKKEENQLIPDAGLKITKENTLSTHTANINFNGETYFDGTHAYMTDSEGKIIKMDSDFENKTILVDTKSQNLTVVEKTLYYTNQDDELCRISTDKKNYEKVIEKAIYYPIIHDNKVYYQLDEDNESIHIYDLTSKKDIKINDRTSYNIQVVDDKIYYTSTDGLYVIGTDGKGEEKLVSGDLIMFVYQEGYLYYSYAESFYSYNIKTKKIETLQTGNIDMVMNIYDQFIYYRNRSGNIYRYDTIKKESASVYNGLCQSLSMVGDILVITTAKDYQKDSEKIIMNLDGSIQKTLFFKNNGKYI